MRVYIRLERVSYHNKNLKKFLTCSLTKDTLVWNNKISRPQERNHRSFCTCFISPRTIKPSLLIIKVFYNSLSPGNVSYHLNIVFLWNQKFPFAFGQNFLLRRGDILFIFQSENFPKQRPSH